MLNRQRAILGLIDEAGGEASHLSVTKWAFLLREESASRGGSAFYQFVPYIYGPFSFSLYQEASSLQLKGYITADSDREWSVTTAGVAAARKVKSNVRSDIKHIIRTHAKKSNRALINYVYNRFPWYTINSKIRQHECRPEAEVAVYTAGYEGLLIDGFLNGLMHNGIYRIIDVRNNPVSRRYGFHKSTLTRLCKKVGIEYVHYPELGIVSRNRQNLDQPGAREKLFDEYTSSTLVSETDAIKEVAKLVSDKPSVLVCMEACHRDCHRSRLAESVARQNGLPIRHLEIKP
ncbi:MAG TPA: DUF488 domain-containing protein [Gammaproteobacteria bacterium]|nr:DUF488 domain-containing protein [Gammaproteobacteria bacterium]